MSLTLTPLTQSRSLYVKSIFRDSSKIDTSYSRGRQQRTDMRFSDVDPTSIQSNKPLINLLRGWPNTSLLPTQMLDRAAHRVLNNKSIAYPAMLYGPDEGDSRLRNSLANWLTDFYSPPNPIPPERITITGGASQNLACLLQVFTDPIYTRNVWIGQLCQQNYHVE